MSLLEIRVLGDPVLRQETTPVPQVTPELQRLIDDMFETMHAAKGVGLAAPQVGRTERVAVVEVDGAQHVLINPEIVEREGTLKWEEGCLSIPEIYGDVTRSARVVVRATGRDGQPVEIEGTELLGVCMQHEIDHLHGKLFIDHLSFLKRQKALAQWEKEKVNYPGLVRVVSPDDPDDDPEHDDERM
ncbi:MAG: peptide deformylase [Gemmatimonadetes bacterium]|nr:peptide deformylase [Gemmatimonadota bacterium]MBI3569458.1 peptide deformylase [Gemmatimonadota bacterium]